MQKKGEDGMGKARKREEMVEDWCVQEMHVEGRCVKEFRVKVLLVKVVCVCQLLCSEDFASANFLRFRYFGWRFPTTIQHAIRTDNRICTRAISKEDGESIKENDVLRDTCFAHDGLHFRVAHFQEMASVFNNTCVFSMYTCNVDHERKTMSAEKRTILRIVFPVEKSER